MGYRGREIEIKLLAPEWLTLAKLNSAISETVQDKFEEVRIISGKRSDIYWPSRCADFVRLREMEDGSAQITVKSTDKGDISNRVEIDLHVGDYKNAKLFMNTAYGEPLEKVTKKYHVYVLENDDTSISVYQVIGDPRVFLEIEARSKKRIREILVDVIGRDSEVEYKWVKTSLYQMFVAGNAMETAPVEEFFS